MASPDKKRFKNCMYRPMDFEAKGRRLGGHIGYGLDENSTASTRSGRTSKMFRRRNVAHAHTVCAISENLAKETCVASIDATSPVSLQVTKQGNGQTYAETLAYLEMLNPDEVLLNEGRKNSQLARKIMELYDVTDEQMQGIDITERRRGRPAVQRNSNDSSLQETNGAAKSETVVKFISRAYFDQTKGSVLLDRIARDDTYDTSVLSEYILLSAAHAVLHYTQQHLCASFSQKSLHLELNSGGTNKMIIDRSTLLQLELLSNAKTGRTKCSLIDTIDYTKTSVGHRLLRTNIMAPPKRIDTITSRLDLVATFLADEEFFYSVMEHLQAFPCLDKMLTNVALVGPRGTKAKDLGTSAEANKKIARKGIAALVGIKTTIAALPALTRTLEDRLLELEQQPRGNSTDQGDTSTLKSHILLGLGGGPATAVSGLQNNHLLRAIIVAMKNPALSKLLDIISSTLTNSTTSANRNAHDMRHEECFALRAGKGSMMSCVRDAFRRNVDDIYERADQYTEKFGFYVTVRYSTSRGYSLSVPEGTSLPPEFIHPAKSGRFISCTTEEVLSLNNRAQDNVQDLLMMTDARIQAIMDVARSHYDAIATLSDAVALLDLCHSFADCASRTSTGSWTRPTVTSEDDVVFSENGMVIQNGRYAIDVSSSPLSHDDTKEFIPNHTYAKDKNFNIVTGINGSGKSTYLKQIAMIVILSHCGSHVPADQAYIPICDRLCTRIGNTDDQEHNISTFMLEMKETAFICQKATPRSLILIDELGRATSNEDGVALAWAVCEKLLKCNARTFFVTHYPQVTSLQNLYPSVVQNQHMEATVGNNEHGDIIYHHKVGNGPCSVATSYGVELAYACGWPEEVLNEARKFESDLSKESNETQLIAADRTYTSEGGTLACTSQVVEALIGQLQGLLDKEGPKDVSSARRSLENIRWSYETNVEDRHKTRIREIVLGEAFSKGGETEGPQNQLASASNQHQARKPNFSPAAGVTGLKEVAKCLQGAPAITQKSDIADDGNSSLTSEDSDSDGSSTVSSKSSSSSTSSSSSDSSSAGDHGSRVETG